MNFVEYAQSHFYNIGWDKIKIEKIIDNYKNQVLNLFLVNGLKKYHSQKVNVNYKGLLCH